MNYYGTFHSYTPETAPDGLPPEMIRNVAWLRNEFDEDLYDVRKRLPAGHLFVIAEADGGVRVVHDDPDHVWPANGGALYATPEDVPRDPMILLTKRFDHSTRQIVDAPRPPAPSVSKRQLKLWLVYNGYSADAVSVEIAKLPEPQRTIATIEYEDASSYSPTHPTLIMVAQALGIADIAQAAREAAEL